MLTEPGRREFSAQRFESQALFECQQLIILEMDDAAKLPLIRKSKIESILEIDRQSLEALGRLVVRDRTQATGHAQMHHHGGAIIEIENQVFGSPADCHHLMTGNARQYVFDTFVAEDTGKIDDAERLNPATDDAIDERTANGFDFGKFWHTQAIVVRAAN